MYIETTISAHKLVGLFRYELKKKGIPDKFYRIEAVDGGIDFIFTLNCTLSLLKRVQLYQSLLELIPGIHIKQFKKFARTSFHISHFPKNSDQYQF